MSNELKEENLKLKEENQKLKEENQKLKREQVDEVIISPNNPNFENLPKF